MTLPCKSLMALCLTTLAPPLGAASSPTSRRPPKPTLRKDLQEKLGPIVCHEAKGNLPEETAKLWQAGIYDTHLAVELWELNPAQGLASPGQPRSEELEELAQGRARLRQHYGALRGGLDREAFRVSRDLLP